MNKTRKCNMLYKLGEKLHIGISGYFEFYINGEYVGIISIK